MANFLKLHDHDGQVVIVNADWIDVFEETSDGGSKIHAHSGRTILVRESPRELAALIKAGENPTWF
jgi:uncharacterized protein YlzI (FlbEa/FlbD family)